MKVRKWREGPGPQDFKLTAFSACVPPSVFQKVGRRRKKKGEEKSEKYITYGQRKDKIGKREGLEPQDFN